LRVLLVNPPCIGEGFYYIKAGSRWPWKVRGQKPPADTPGFYNPFPFFMFHVASYLAMTGIADVFPYDAVARAHDMETFYKAVDEVKPDITIIETTTPTIENDLRVAEIIKSKGSEIALSGPHATVFADDLTKLPCVDYVLKGEYEVSSYEMCLMRRKGIYESRPFTNLDALPSPYLIRDEVLLQYQDTFNFNFPLPQLTVQTSRGCPYKCNFCLWNHTMTKTYRQKSVRKVIKEITACMREWGFRSVLLDDDTFNAGDKRTIEMSEALDKIDIEWQAMVRIDGCSRRAFTMMREYGCTGLKIGVETFSQNGLNYLGKGGDGKKNYEMCHFLLDLGFKVYLSFIDDIPAETAEDKEYNAQCKESLAKRGAMFQSPKLMALPGTKLAETTKPFEKWEQYGEY